MLSVLNEFAPIAAIATTPHSSQLLQTLSPTSDITLWIPESLTNIPAAKHYQGSLKEHLTNIWSQYRAFIFCLATGAVIRLIAPLLQDKSIDPAIVVIDETGKFVISLCGGHQGGADLLTQLIALELDATPILTGASSALNLPAIDLLGIPFGWKKGEGDWTKVSAAVAKGELVQIIQECGCKLWQNNLPKNHSFYFGFGENTDNLSPKARIWISATCRKFAPNSELPKVQWHPRVLWVGIGCERGTSQELIETAIQQVCKSNHLAEKSIAGIATIDIKSDEIGLVKLCKKNNWPLLTFPAEVLRNIPIPNPSDIVAAEVGTPSVAEAAALTAAKVDHLLVSKKIIRLPEETGAVTVAMAMAEIEYSDRPGQLLLIGTGPGKLEQITPAAKKAITSADVIIGYSLYIDLISPLFRPGQIIEPLPITKERERAQRAIELATRGLNVAVVSSGDCGIYGMAGLVLEELRAINWDGKKPGVQVFPGISALQAAASRVGAPLMHDFCAISLSDLLTPWEVITKRLTAAAQADFVTAIYNPKSKTRTEQLASAQAIFLQYRDRLTPVAVVRSAYRESEEIMLTTLEKLLELPVDMMTVILIGNQSTCIYEDWMITPRGYLGFNLQ